MCTGRVYRMTRCKHYIVHYTSHCRRYQNTHPPKKPTGDLLMIPEAPEDPCPQLWERQTSHDNSKSRKPVVVVAEIEDSCACCLPRMHEWKINWDKHRLDNMVEGLVQGCFEKGDRVGAAAQRGRLMKLERDARAQVATLDWSVIPAPEPVYPPSWTVEDDRALSAAWIGGRLVWGDEEGLRKLRLLRSGEEEEKRQCQEQEEQELEYDDDDDDDDMRTILGDQRPRNAEVDEDEDEDEEDDDDYSYYTDETRTGYILSDDDDDEQDQRFRAEDDREPLTTRPSRESYPSLRKQKGREVLGDAEFFANLESSTKNDHRDSYHIDDNNNDDDELWLKVPSSSSLGPQQPRGQPLTSPLASASASTSTRPAAAPVHTTAATGFVPRPSRTYSQWSPDTDPVYQNKRAAVLAMRELPKKKYDLKPYIPSQHQHR